MTIRIASRMHPFCHLPGTLCLLPKTHLKLQIFPTRVDFFLCEEANVLFSLMWDMQGPVKDFTVELDLEQQLIVVYGMTSAGYMRYRLQRQAEGISVILDKLSQESISCHLSLHNKTYLVSRGQTLLIPWTFSEKPAAFQPERLSLGMHKMQDWQLICRRLDLKEIFPIWMRLGQITPHLPLAASLKGNMSLLNKCQEIVQKNLKQEVTAAFTQLFMAAFEGICVPRLFDTDYQGIAPMGKLEAIDPSPLVILTEGAALIRSLFIQETQDSLCLLPCLPAAFHAGRMIEVHTLLKDRIDLEWTKKQLRCVVLRPGLERRLRLKISGHFQKCRVRASLKDRGKEYSINQGLLELDAFVGKLILMDRFQK